MSLGQWEILSATNCTHIFLAKPATVEKAEKSFLHCTAKAKEFFQLESNGRVSQWVIL